MSFLVLQSITSGIVTGCVYALIALSLVIVYKSTDAVNFAAGEMTMIGGYLGLLMLAFLDLSYPIAFIVVAFASFMLGGLFDRLVIQKILGRSRPGQDIMVAIAMATIGLSFVAKGIVRVIPYTEEVRTLPPVFQGPPIIVGPVILQRQDIVIVAVAATLMIALWYFFKQTMIGRALRATSQNTRAAALVGIPVQSMQMTVWGIAAALASVGGILLAPKLLMTPDMGILVVLALAAAAIGGFNSLPGAVVGGIILGITQNLVGVLIGAHQSALAPFIAIMMILTFRPQGLFGTRQQAKKL